MPGLTRPTLFCQYSVLFQSLKIFYKKKEAILLLNISQRLNINKHQSKVIYSIYECVEIKWSPQSCVASESWCVSGTALNPSCSISPQGKKRRGQIRRIDLITLRGWEGFLANRRTSEHRRFPTEKSHQGRTHATIIRLGLRTTHTHISHTSVWTMAGVYNAP